MDAEENYGSDFSSLVVNAVSKKEVLQQLEADGELEVPPEGEVKTDEEIAPAEQDRSNRVDALLHCNTEGYNTLNKNNLRRW